MTEPNPQIRALAYGLFIGAFAVLMFGCSTTVGDCPIGEMLPGKYQVRLSHTVECPNGISVRELEVFVTEDGKLGTPAITHGCDAVPADACDAPWLGFDCGDGLVVTGHVVPEGAQLNVCGIEVQADVAVSE